MADEKPEEPTDEHGKKVVRGNWFHGDPARIDDHQDGHTEIAGIWDSYIGAADKHVTDLSNVFKGRRLDDATNALIKLIREADGHAEVSRERSKRCGQLAEAYRDGKWKMDSVVAISRVERLEALRYSQGYESDEAEEEALRLARRAVDMVVTEVVEHPAHMAEGEKFGVLFGEDYAPAGTDHDIELERPVTAHAQPESGAVAASTPHEADPFKEHAALWPPQPGSETHDHGASTETQSASAPAREAATQTQGAESVDSSTTNIEYTDTSTQAAGAMAVGNLGFAPGEPREWKPNKGWRRNPFFQETLRGAQEQHDPYEWLTFVGRWLKEQIVRMPEELRQLAISGQPAFAILLHLNSDHQYEFFVFTNFGSGAVLPPFIGLPDNLRSGWLGSNDATKMRMIGHADPLKAGLEHYKSVAYERTLNGEHYALIGYVSTLRITPEIRDEYNKCNDHLKGEMAIAAPYGIEAERPAIVQAPQQITHALALIDPELYPNNLYGRLLKIIQNGRAEQIRTLAPGWVARCLDVPSARGKEGFNAVISKINAGEHVSPDLARQAEADAHEMAVKMWDTLTNALKEPEDQRGVWLLAFHRTYLAQLAALALKRWGPTQIQQVAPDPRTVVQHDAWMFDVVYLAATIYENAHSWLYDELPDPDEHPGT